MAFDCDGPSVTNIRRFKFVLDSGATSHFINKNTFLVNEVSASIEISSCKCALKTTVQSKGNLFICNENGSIRLDVMYLPDFDKNLLSIPVMCKNGYEVVFGNLVCIKQKCDNALVATASETQNGLYIVEFEIKPLLEHCESAYYTITSEETVLWPSLVTFAVMR